MVRTDEEWDDLDREIAAMIRQDAIDRQVRRRMTLRHYRRDVLPWVVWGLVFGSSLGWLALTIWG